MKTQSQHWTTEERELIQAVVSIDVADVKAKISKLQNKRILEDIGWAHIPFPLHYITLCQDVILGNPNEWYEVQLALHRKEQIRAMIAFWKAYYNVSDFSPIDYALHKDYYYDRQTETDSNILWADPNDFVAAGFDIKDVELYCAAIRFDFNRVRQLLNDGATPDITLALPNKNVYHNTLKDISIEESLLYTEVDIYGEHPWAEKDIRLFVALTAHCEMYNLLNKYRK